MTNNTNPLQERIARILNDEGWTFEGVHEPGDYDECEDCRRAVDPIAARIAEEVAAEAIDQARQGNLDGADFNRAVAAEIEKTIPEETP